MREKIKITGKTYLSNKGYSISKEGNEDVIEKLKDDLTVSPRTFNMMDDAEPIYFPLYRENAKKLYIPRFYGLQKFGVPNVNQLEEGEDVSGLIFNGSIRENQKEPIEKFLDAMKTPTKMGGIISVPPGYGKTVMGLYIASIIKKKTLIICHKDFLSNQWKERIEQYLPKAKVGKIKQKIVDVEDKDIVMGSLQSIAMKDYDSNIFKQFGIVIIDECFPYDTKIQTNQGLFRIGTLYEKWKTSKDYNELPKIYSFNEKTKEFELKSLTYAWRKEHKELLKVKLSKRVINCTPDHKILTTKGYIKAKDLTNKDFVISKYDKNHIDNIISLALNNDQLQIIYGSYLGDGHIYKTSCCRYRLGFTHGINQIEYCKWKAKMFNVNNLRIIENNGYSQKQACCFSTKIFDCEIDFPKDTKFIPNEILDRIDFRGIAIWLMDDGSLSNNQISIHTNNFSYEQNLKLVNMFKLHGINCTIKKSRVYFYLNFDKNNSINLINKVKPYIHDSMLYKINLKYNESKYKWNNSFLNYGLLRVSYIEYYNNKGANRCSKPYVYDIEVDDNHNFVIGSYKKYIDGIVVSNCHHLSAEVFSRCLPKITTRYMCGLSATLNRKDGLRRVFEWFVGKPVYSLKNKGDELNVIVKRFYDPHPEYGRELKMWNKKLNVAKMINKICEFPPRNYMIINTLFQLLEDEPDRQVIILSERRTHLNIFEDLLKIHNISENDIGYYVGGMKQTDLDISSTKKFILATNQQASEGMDIPTLNTLILSSPVSSIEQAIGRIQRQKKEERIYTPTVIDIIDEFSLFERQGNKRLSFYKNNNYTILDKKKELDDINKNIKHQFMIDSDEEN